MELVTVVFFQDPTKAHLAKMKLEGEGIEARLVGRGIRHPHSDNPRVEILVREKDYERAFELVGKQSDTNISFGSELLFRFHHWLPVLPISILGFFAARFLLGAANPDLAEVKGWQYDLAGPAVGMLCACLTAPKWKLGIGLLVFGIFFQIARNM